MKIVISLLLMTSLIIPSLLWAQNEKQLPLLHTSAQAEITGDNDSAQIQVSIITEGKRLDACHKQNAQKADTVSVSLKRMKIKNLKIKTANYNVIPKRNYKNKTQEIVGYKIQNTLSLSIEDLSKEKLSLTVSKLLDTALTNGANQIGSINFYIKNEQPLINQALTKATKRALAKSQTLAQAAGIQLGAVHRLSSDSSQHSLDGPGPWQKRGSYMKAASAPSTVIEAGESKIIATVSISYKIK